MRPAALLALISALLIAPARGEDAPSQEQPVQEKPTQAYGEDHPSCLEWTDGCLVCARQDDGAAACSMVGAACLPAAVSCLQTK
ncbi:MULTISPECIES: hypothetical protein [Methylosinus]|uniref:Uncharacterized protein n=1 Tax=Methylosinus trichosporium (strain ATCC 35070 / NCIMB 11131 / UNIQEM 75 / OB3b) TaxID=595536 RepID=A0A2D2D1S2_METT3|nr:MULTISPECIES: hypothetical protein [Methylosinus]ATQ68930.1 hypothetical protein CQW49_14330 [Methylosinus trichosporium OB3b]OBS52279.1 hypothetical protein A8B73_11855 [Methylosinus sp. 3S-1]